MPDLHTEWQAYFLRLWVCEEMYLCGGDVADIFSCQLF